MNYNNENQPKSKQEKTSSEFDKEQYEMLRHCSENKDVSEWNQWRKKNPNVPILLKGAKIYNAKLKGINLERANLENASLRGADLEGACLVEANLKSADLGLAYLRYIALSGANLQGADLGRAKLIAGDIVKTNLKGAYLVRANLQDAYLTGSYLQCADFRFAVVNGTTIIVPREFDRFTDFTGVGLNDARIDPGTKQLFEYNIRRLRWENWYKGNSEKRWKTWIRSTVTLPIRTFWWVSDYGLSTGRIVFTFFGFAIIFALVYYFFHGLVYDLHVTGSRFSDLIRACYFSIVTMTTLGFGDMYAEPGSKAGHVLLILQVLFGYILLAALVTRFAVLFTAGGPAGSFPKKKSKNWEQPPVKS